MKTLNIFQYWLTRIGFNYLVNLHTKEIHNLNKRMYGCQIDLIRYHHRLFVPKFVMLYLLKKGYNGCWHCNREFDKKHFKKKVK